MKRLILVRHGKSSWKHDVEDSQRPLKKRAYRDADKVIEALKSQIDSPLILWTSFAVRALESAKIFKKELEIDDQDFTVRKDLYTFVEEQLLKVISTCEDTIGLLMVFGHNPAITAAVNQLGDENFDNVPTTGLVLIEFETDSWSKIKNGKTILNLFPKNL